MDGVTWPLWTFDINPRSNSVSKKRSMQLFIRQWKEDTGSVEIDMQKVAAYALSKGWKPPQPKSAVDILAKEFATAAREDIEKDPKTGRPYRVYHAFPYQSGQTTLFTYWDIREAPRRVMHKSLVMRREQMVGDGLQLSFDQDFWNSLHPEEEPINLPMDLTPDIEWRRNSPDDDAEAA